MGIEELPYKIGSAVLGWAGNAATLLDAFIALNPTTYVNGSTEDFIEFTMTYDCIDQYTYVWSTFYNDWSLGLFTQSITLKAANVRQYYYDPNERRGEEETSSLLGNGLNEDYKSEYFDDPYETAIAFRNTGAYDWVTASVDDLVLSFVN